MKTTVHAALSLLRVIIALAICLGFGFNRVALAESSPGSRFTIEDNALVEYSGKNKTVVIPEGVERIECSFYSPEIETIEIPSTMKDIAAEAFLDLPNLRNIKISEKNTSFEFEDGFFVNTDSNELLACVPGDSLTISVPDTVAAIRESAFFNCVNVSTLRIPASVSEIDPYSFTEMAELVRFEVSLENQDFSALGGVLYDKGQTHLLSYPRGKRNQILVVPETVIEIGENAVTQNSFLRRVRLGSHVETLGGRAFANCNLLQSIENQVGLKKIEESAFEENSSLSSFEVGPNVQSLSNLAFMYCYKLSEVSVSADNKFYTSEDGVVYKSGEKGEKILWLYPCNKKSSDFKIPFGTTSIAADSFSDSVEMQGVTIPTSVTSIGERAFYNSGLTSLVLPNSVTTLGEMAFSACADLEWAFIPNTVTSIASNVFYRSENNIIIRTNSFYITTYAQVSGLKYEVEADPKFYEFSDVDIIPNPVVINGEKANIAEFKIKGSYYFDLSELGQALTDLGIYYNQAYREFRPVFASMLKSSVKSAKTAGSALTIPANRCVKIAWA
ncbi:MAG: leucine-rich repeat domain-containing protein, partial [Clostridiales bacterium]|nr:leucine-rich repeat domain-containing protein [Clostridiales bacterium]